MLENNVFLKQVTSVLTGTVIAQMIPILGSLLIARLYIPEDFGIFSAWLAIAMIIATMLSGRYELALVLVEDGQSRENAVITTIMITILGVCLVTPIIYFLYKAQFQFIALFNLYCLLLIAPSAALVTFSQIWQSWVAADGQFKKLTQIRIAQAFFVTVFQIAFGYIEATVTNLCFAYLIGNSISIILTYFICPLVNTNNSLLEMFTQSKIFLQRYKNFPLISLPAGSVNVISGQLPLIIVATNFGADKAGYLALTMRVLGTPIAILGKSVLDVFKRNASISYRESGHCQREYTQTFKLLFIFAIIFAVCTILFGEKIFILAFGERWQMSGVLAIWLLPLFIMRFMASPLSYTIFLAEKQHIDLVWQIILLLATIVSFKLTSNFKLTILIYSLFYSFLYVIYLFISYRLSRDKA